MNTGNAADRAIAQYDANGDRQLQQPEWSACPALAGSIDVYDQDGDKTVNREELIAGLDRWQKGDMGARPLPFQVTLNGRPLEKATVRLVPEQFLGPSIRPAEGVTGQGGRGFLGAAKDDLPAGAPTLPLVLPGLYRVEITHPQIKLAAKYNVETTLGLEVTGNRPDPRGVVWNLAN